MKPGCQEHSGQFSWNQQDPIYLPYGVAAKVLDQVWIHGTAKDPGIMEGMEDWLVIPTRAFHDHPGLAIKVLYEPGKVI